MARRKGNSVPGHQKYTVLDFHSEFPNDDVCLNHIMQERYPDGITYCDSEKCQQDRRHHRVSGRTAFACDYCGKHIYPLAGTIFEKSSTPLTKWFFAMYLLGSTRCGISAKQLQREIGVTYKTAWRMFKQIRTLMGEEITVEGSSVEMDETYIGGTRKYGRGRPMRGDKVKTPVAGIVERKGRVIARTVSDATGATLLGMVKECILPSSIIYTDEWAGYDGIKHMPEMKYKHRRIKHSAKVYVRGKVHTNTIEGFWSLVKRGVGGVYHSVSQKYLQSYLDEYSFRYNRRDVKQPMFTLLLERVSETAD